MTQSDYLLISRGQWDETASPQDVQAAIDRFYAWYERGLADGAKLELDGRKPQVAGYDKGNFVGPTTASPTDRSPKRRNWWAVTGSLSPTRWRMPHASPHRTRAWPSAWNWRSGRWRPRARGRTR